jgi:6-pyruvoyltetrahydropterin/6-carboxytetrahydropterin synthase
MKKTRPAMRIVKSIKFDAAHFLDHDPAARPYARLHGHSFTMDVEIAGEPDPEAGWVVDFGDVADALEELREALDHRLLNEVEGLERPTLENICQWAAARLKSKFKGLKQIRVSRPSNGEMCIFDVED